MAVKTAISLREETFRRVEHAARKLGVSRSEFFTRAAERWLDEIEQDGTTDAINRAIAGITADAAFTAKAAAALRAAEAVERHPGANASGLPTAPAAQSTDPAAQSDAYPYADADADAESHQP